MLAVKNWSKFQHFKNRRPPWIKLYRDLLEDVDWHELTGDTAKVLVSLWLIASERNGELPSLRALAFRLHLTEAAVAKHLATLKHWLRQDDDNMMTSGCQGDTPEREGEREIETEKIPRASKSRSFALPDWLTSLPEWKPDLWDAWLDTRRRKRASNTPHALGLLVDKLAQRKGDAVAAIRTAVEAGWQGFEWAWFDGRKAGCGRDARGVVPVAPQKPTNEIGGYAKEYAKLIGADGIAEEDDARFWAKVRDNGLAMHRHEIMTLAAGIRQRSAEPTEKTRISVD
jgi:hypothetical protein